VWRQQYVDEHMRATDVVINTMPKTGQTLLQTMLVAVKHKGAWPGTTALLDESPWVEVNFVAEDTDGNARLRDRDEQVAHFERVASPRVFKQHVAWSEVATPTDAAAAAGVKYVTITRDIRDVPYSFFCHLHHMQPEALELMELPPPPPTFDAFFDALLDSPMQHQFFTFAAEFWPHRNDANVLTLEYERVVNDKAGTVRRLCDFLGWPQFDDAATLTAVLDKVSVQWMQQNERLLFGRAPFRLDDGRHFARQGKVGKNREQLSADQLRRLRAKCEATLPPDCVAYLYRERGSWRHDDGGERADDTDK